jgi:hypothetical protein
MIKDQLRKKRPDRVFGLKATKAFNKVLEVITSQDDHLSYTPFVESQDPILFPFLIMEAKPEKSSPGFEEIQVQTGFPILALLNLQKYLREKMAITTHAPTPFVWFLASRGDMWRAYGCYITQRDDRQTYVSINVILPIQFLPAQLSHEEIRRLQDIAG